MVEGRDIGSVVWPAAGLKVFLTADPSARAARRAAEAGSARRHRDPGVPAPPRPDRLRPRRGAADDGRRRRPHRHHRPGPRRGRRPGRRARDRDRRTSRHEQRAAHLERPRSDVRPAPAPLAAAAAARPTARWIIRRRYDVRVHQRGAVPRARSGRGGRQPHRRDRRPADGDLRAPAGARADQDRDVRRLRSGRSSTAVRPDPARPVPRRPAGGAAEPAGAARRRRGRRLPRGHPGQRRAGPVPARRGLPRDGDRCARRTPDLHRQPGARRPHQLAPGEAGTDRHRRRAPDAGRRRTVATAAAPRSPRVRTTCASGC